MEIDMSENLFRKSILALFAVTALSGCSADTAVYLNTYTGSPK